MKVGNSNYYDMNSHMQIAKCRVYSTRPYGLPSIKTWSDFNFFFLHERKTKEKGGFEKGGTHMFQKKQSTASILFSQMPSKQRAENALGNMPSSNTKQIGAHLCKYKTHKGSPKKCKHHVF